MSIGPFNPLPLAGGIFQGQAGQALQGNVSLMPGAVPTTTTTAPTSAFGQFWNNNGQGIMTGLNALTGLTNLYGGFKALGLQEDAFDFEKEKFNKNYANQVKAYENQLRDQWFARNNSMRARGQDYMSEDSFLRQRGLTGNLDNTVANSPQGNTGNTPSDDRPRRRRSGTAGGG